MRRFTPLLALLVLAAACGGAASDDTAATTTTTTTAPSTTTTAAPTTTTPSVFSSTDYCTSYIELVDIDDDYWEQYEDPTGLPEYRDFLRDAFRAMAEYAPSEIKSDWEFFRDFYETDPTTLLEEGLDGVDYTRDERILDYAIVNCADS